MRVISFALFVAVFAFWSVVFGQQIESVDEPTTVHIDEPKRIVIEDDFCEECACCNKISQEQSQPRGSDSSYYGTTRLPQIANPSVTKILDQLQEKYGISESALTQIESDSRITAMTDLCEECNCCIETPDTIILKGTGNSLPLADKFQIEIR